MKVAIFGAAGWVGRAVLANFRDRHEVRAFDLNAESWEKYRELDGEWEGEKLSGDMADFEAADAASAATPTTPAPTAPAVAGAHDEAISARATRARPMPTA